jgi:hypothetical protein
MGKGVYYLRKSLNDFLKIINCYYYILIICYFLFLKRKNSRNIFPFQNMPFPILLKK